MDPGTLPNNKAPADWLLSAGALFQKDCQSSDQNLTENVYQQIRHVTVNAPTRTTLRLSY